MDFNWKSIGPGDRKWTKISPKKVHEVLHFARLIGDNCHRNEVQHVVDVGAGLVA